MKTKLIILALSALLASGCSTLSKQDCQTYNWDEVGYQDALSGQPAERFHYYQEACSAHDITPPRHAYTQGHERGLHEFCTAKNGFHWGRRGQKYNESCPPHAEDIFLNAYRDGHILHTIWHEVEMLQDEKRYAEQQISENRNAAIDNTADAAMSPDGFGFDDFLDVTFTALEASYENDRLRDHIRFIDGRITVLRKDYKDAEQALNIYD